MSKLVSFEKLSHGYICIIYQSFMFIEGEKLGGIFFCNFSNSLFTLHGNGTGRGNWTNTIGNNFSWFLSLSWSK